MQRRIALLLVILIVLAAGAGAAAWQGAVPGGRALRALVMDAKDFAAWEHARHAERRLRAFASEDAPADAVVFLGSGWIEDYPLHSTFPGKPVVNRGVTGDAVTDVRARLGTSLRGLDPAAFVVHVGADDIRRDGSVAAQVRDELARLLDELHAAHADVPITVVGLFARPDAEESEVYETHLYNIAAQRAAVQRKAAFVSLEREPLTDEDGRLVASFATSDGGLDPSGYDQATEWLLRNGGHAASLLAP